MSFECEKKGTLLRNGAPRQMDGFYGEEFLGVRPATLWASTMRASWWIIEQRDTWSGGERACESKQLKTAVPATPVIHSAVATAASGGINCDA